MSANIQSGTYGATIFYTTNSNDPAPDSPDSPKYAGSDIRVGKPMTIEAKADELDMAERRVRVATYANGLPSGRSAVRTSLFRYLVAAALALPADPRHAFADPAGPAEVCRAAFTEDYTVPVYQTTAPAGAAADAPVRIHSYAFTSRKGTTSAGGRTYRRFRLRVQEYAGEAAAANALRRLSEVTAGNTR